MTAGLVLHACKHCLGQLRELTAAEGFDGTGYECTGCGARALGKPERICGCGIMAAPIRKAGPRFHCIANPERTPARPAAVVITFDEVAAP